MTLKVLKQDLPFSCSPAYLEALGFNFPQLLTQNSYSNPMTTQESKLSTVQMMMEENIKLHVNLQIL
jgi:hypothetical protein